jgi:cobalt-zinc-cadmium resistance protein CzcA
LIVSAVDNLRMEGVELRTAVIEGAVTRLRALLMTALLAMSGLMPMAISTGLGSETQKPFAVVIIGGMATTLFVALFVLPAIYTLVTPRRLAGPQDEDDELPTFTSGPIQPPEHAIRRTHP